MKTRLTFTIFFILTCLGMMPGTNYASAQPSQVISFTNQTRNNRQIMLGDRISVKVTNLDSLLLQQNDTGTLILYLNGIGMTGIRGTCEDKSTGMVSFMVCRCDDNDPWDVFYVSPLPEYWKREVKISVGYATTGPIKSTAQTGDLVIIRVGYFWVAMICILLILGLFLYMNNRGLLKDYSSLPLKERPFSLSRSQLGFWTLVVSMSYIFIALVTGELAPLTSSTLVLLGISGATTAAAGIIDKNDALNAGVVRTQDVNKSEGFFTDILSDANGVSVHRFQMVVFNFILGLFFIKQVFTRLEMPGFDSNLLILMGLSNATYAGLKSNENKLPPPPPPPGGAASPVPPVTDVPPSTPPPANI